MYSVELYRRLQAERVPGRLDRERRHQARVVARAARGDPAPDQLGAHVRPAAARDLARPRSPSGSRWSTSTASSARAYLDSDGYLDPSQLCYALANQRARRRASRSISTPASSGSTSAAAACAGVRTDRATSSARSSSTAAACSPPRSAGWPACASRSSRCRTSTWSPSRSATRGDAAAADAARPRPARLLPPGGRRAGDGRLRARPGAVDGRAAHATTRSRPTSTARLLAEDWPRFEEIATNAQRRVPVLADVGVRRMINGPEAFTPDNEFCLGETDGRRVLRRRRASARTASPAPAASARSWPSGSSTASRRWTSRTWTSAGSAAQYRSPAYTLARTLENYRTYYDIPYPGPPARVGRGLRRSPAYDWHREHGAVFGEKAGWERVDYYEPNAARAATRCGRPGWAGARLVAGDRRRAPRAPATAAGLFDESSFAKIEVSGADAARVPASWVCDNDVARGVGDVTYTQALNARGGIECDFTVTRTRRRRLLDRHRHRVRLARPAWLRTPGRAARTRRCGSPTSPARRAASRCGGRARATSCRALTPADLSNDAFPFMTAQELTVGDVPVRALRVTFVGELGWELYASTEYGAALWETLWAAGRAGRAGRRRLPRDRQHAAREGLPGLGQRPHRRDHAVRGRARLLREARQAGRIRRPRRARGGEGATGRPGGCARSCSTTRRRSCSAASRCGSAAEVVGRVTSGGFGYTLGASIALRLPAGRARTGHRGRDRPVRRRGSAATVRRRAAVRSGAADGCAR